MKTTQEGSRHLSPDEIVDQVFPSAEGPVAVPSHLASCAACQAGVAHLREAWLLDRGAVEGVVDAVPKEFWEAETAAVMGAIIAGEGETAAVLPAEGTGVHPFPVSARRSFLRRPVLALGSLAAALVLVTGITVSRLRAPAPRMAQGIPQTPTLRVTPASGDAADEELLLSVDRVLSDDAPLGGFLSEETL
jgi:hypothetical protein